MLSERETQRVLACVGLLGVAHSTIEAKIASTPNLNESSKLSRALEDIETVREGLFAMTTTLSDAA